MIEAFLEEETPYIVEVGGIYFVGTADLDDSGEVFSLDTVYKSFIVADFEEQYVNGQFVYVPPEGDWDTIYVRPLTPENYADLFPEQIRTFKDNATIQSFMLRKMGQAYLMDETEYSYAVTLDEGAEGQRSVLELTRTSTEGDMEYREGGNWTPVTAEGDYPTIYDRAMIFIDNEDVEAVEQLFDSKESSDEGFVESEVSQYAALI